MREDEKPSRNPLSGQVGVNNSGSDMIARDVTEIVIPGTKIFLLSLLFLLCLFFPMVSYDVGAADAHLNPPRNIKYRVSLVLGASADRPARITRDRAVDNFSTRTRGLVVINAGLLALSRVPVAYLAGGISLSRAAPRTGM